MAEGVFRHKTKYELPGANPHIKQIDSCGTGAYHVGDSPDPRTMSVLSDHGITSKFYTHAARKFETSDFETFDYIFAMDKDNKDYLDRARKQWIKKGGDLADKDAAKVTLFGEWGGNGKEEVDDPYYGAGDDGFRIAYEQMDRFSDGFLKMLENKSHKSK